MLPHGSSCLVRRSVYRTQLFFTARCHPAISEIAISAFFSDSPSQKIKSKEVLTHCLMVFGYRTKFLVEQY